LPAQTFPVLFAPRQNQLALELVDQVLAWELSHPPVVFDSAYGNDFDFRATLRELELH
jgi:hypothetical protein